jgi:outer membrane PBP1 activator LpoA protein
LKPDTLKLFLCLGLAVVLAACETQPGKPDLEPVAGETTRPPVTPHQATLAEEAEQLLMKADDSDTGAEKRRYQLQAARLFLQAGDIGRAKYLHDDIKQQLQASTTAAETEFISLSLLATEIAIVEKNAPLATELISDIKPVSREQQLYFYSLKADIDYLSGKPMYAVDRRVQLDSYLTDSRQKELNNKKIWAALSSLSTEQLNKERQNRQRNNKAIIDGWLDLANVMRSGQQHIGKLENDLLDWGTRHPTHPASGTFLTSLVDNYQLDISGQKRIAILLPMQGELSKVTTTIKNGMLSAYYNDKTSPIKPVLNFLDTSSEGVIFRQLYQQAIDDGATHIIGPLDKVEINQLAQQRELDIPVLTLNQSENMTSHTENLFQFGLSPEDEARQVAELAIMQNKFRAAVFFPDSDWGKRLNKAFTEHYEYLGGTVLASSDYATNTNDYRRPVRALFNLDQSDIRRRKVEDTIGMRTQSEPQRRMDIDMIFLAATHRSARSIMPAFKFHHAGDLPVYATSHVYTGKINRELDRDLNGLIFCDLPWVLDNNSELEKTFTRNWPQQGTLTRLFALGIDAYHLIYNLEYLQNRDYAFYSGQTGNIQLDEYNRITRKLLWAKFERGIPVQFQPVDTRSQNDTQASNSQ